MFRGSGGMSEIQSRNGSNGQILEARVDDAQATIALQKLYRRESFEPATEVTPIDEIFSVEEATYCPNCHKMIDLGGSKHFMGNVETIRLVAQYCAQDGLEPLNVLRNLYAIFAYMGLPLFTGLRLRERGKILGDSHGSEHLRAQRVVNFVQRKRRHAFKSAGQKSIRSRASFSECQQGNKNRKRQNRSRHRRWKEKEKKQQRRS